jgi:phage terminase large subunit-like protein
MERLRFFKSLSEAELEAMEHEWDFWCRTDQQEPGGDWVTWMVKAGRGYGKTRMGAEFILRHARTPRRRLCLIGKTPADVRDTMIEGDSGILTVASITERPRYEPTKRRLSWKNGSIATSFSGEVPDALRGPQHHAGWVDELAKFKYPQKTWDNFMFGLRLGEDPRACVTTTPRPTPTMREILSDPSTIVTHGSTYLNAANLAPTFLSKILKKYQGTRLGRQEIDGDLLDDLIGALWTYPLLDQHRVDVPPLFRRIVIAIDPAASSDEENDETGIVVAGLGQDAHGYVLQDATGHYTPGQWGAKAVELYKDWKADAIVGETNNGGEMVGYTVKTAAEAAKETVRFVPVHASRGKLTRAEPIGALYEQGRCHHVGTFAELEDQMCNWIPGADSPDRMDALVWAFTELMLGEQTTGLLDYYAGLYAEQQQAKQPKGST